MTHVHRGTKVPNAQLGEVVETTKSSRRLARRAELARLVDEIAPTLPDGDVAWQAHRDLTGLGPREVLCPGCIDELCEHSPIVLLEAGSDDGNWPSLDATPDFDRIVADEGTRCFRCQARGEVMVFTRSFAKNPERDGGRWVKVGRDPETGAMSHFAAWDKLTREFSDVITSDVLALLACEFPEYRGVANTVLGERYGNTRSTRADYPIVGWR